MGPKTTVIAGPPVLAYVVAMTLETNWTYFPIPSPICSAGACVSGWALGGSVGALAWEVDGLGLIPRPCGLLGSAV